LNLNHRIISGYLASGIVVAILLIIQSELGYPRTYNLIVLGIYDLFLIIHLTVVSHPFWLVSFVPLFFAEIWINGGLAILLFFLSLSVVVGITAESYPMKRRW
jgi:hypothetical protein